MLLPLLLVQGRSLKRSGSELALMALLAALYIGSALGLQLGYRYMSTGIATLIHFSYPLFVVLISALIFRERPSFLTQLSVLFSLSGVLLIAGAGQGKSPIALSGFLIVLSTALCYALCLIMVQRSRLKHIDSMVLCWYMVTFCAMSYALMALCTGGIQLLPTVQTIGSALGLGLVATVCANLLVVQGVKHCGSTMSSILGALEPLTAVVVGVLLFAELLRVKHIMGMSLILVAIILSAVAQKRKGAKRRYIIN